MVTNITKLQQLYDMQSHTAAYVDTLLSKHLPFGYSSKAQKIAKSKGRTIVASRVRQVKQLHDADLQILNILIELAKENKAVAEAELAKFKTLTTNN